MADKPTIGIPLDHAPASSYADGPHYALRPSYDRMVSSCGAIPIHLPHTPAHIETYLDMIDALLIPGSDTDINPELYNEAKHPETSDTNDARDAFLIALIHKAIERKMPLLGICLGHQCLNVALGGSVIQHIPDVIDDAHDHQPGDRLALSHDVEVKDGTLLSRIAPSERFSINTNHHQAIGRIGAGLTVNALACDGVIEGVEYNDHPFCLGIQWHCELNVTTSDIPIFDALVAAARAYQSSKH